MRRDLLVLYGRYGKVTLEEHNAVKAELAAAGEQLRAAQEEAGRQGEQLAALQAAKEAADGELEKLVRAGLGASVV